jgi:hypothetical protein
VVPAKPKTAHPIIAAVSLSLVLPACGPSPPRAADAADTSSPETAYLAPPAVDTIRSGPGGLVLSGVAPVDGKVRLATPTGEALFAPAGAHGRWTISLPPAQQPRIFGLSVAVGGRQAQAEGYVLVTQAGQAALLRAGAGAQRIDRPAHPGLTAIDYDKGGGVVVSAAAPPGATVILRLDGREAGLGRADADGRYEASFGPPAPIRPGQHQVQVSGDGFSDQATITVSPAAPLADGPLRSQLTPAGLRVDWMTPGGGVQTTLLIH